MRPLFRSSFVITFALLCSVIFFAPQTASAQTDTPGVLVISEFRFDGPGAPGDNQPAGNDDYVEICNNSASTITVQSTDGSPGYGLYRSFGGNNEEPTLVFTIPNNTVLEPGRCFLGAGAGYSLGSYQAPDVTFTSDIDIAIGLFSSSNVVFTLGSGFRSGNAGSTVTRFDSVALGVVCPAVFPNRCMFVPQFAEGQTLTPVSNMGDVQYAYVRRNVRGSDTKQDTGNNRQDFYDNRAVSVTPVSNESFQTIPGSPGPEGLTAPLDRRQPSEFTFSNFDPNTSAVFAPNRERIFAAPSGSLRPDNNETTAPRGTFAIRGTYTNSSNQTISQLRFRIVDLTTVNRGLIIGQSENEQAILRLISSETRRVFVQQGRDQDCVNPPSGSTTQPSGTQPCGGSGFKLVQGLALEIPPNLAANGGGVNSGLLVENNQNFIPQTQRDPGAGGGIVAGMTSPSEGSVPSSAFLRGAGTLSLARGLAPGEQISVEFRFGVERTGRFLVSIVLEGR